MLYIRNCTDIQQVRTYVPLSCTYFPTYCPFPPPLPPYLEHWYSKRLTYQIPTDFHLNQTNLWQHQIRLIENLGENGKGVDGARDAKDVDYLRQFIFINQQL